MFFGLATPCTLELKCFQKFISYARSTRDAKLKIDLSFRLTACETIWYRYFFNQQIIPCESLVQFLHTFNH